MNNTPKNYIRNTKSKINQLWSAPHNSPLIYITMWNALYTKEQVLQGKVGSITLLCSLN